MSNEAKDWYLSRTTKHPWPANPSLLCDPMTGEITVEQPYAKALNVFVAGTSGPLMANVVYHHHRQIRMEVAISFLLDQITEMKSEIARLQETRTFAVPLSTLAPEPFEMTKPIFVTIHGDGENFTATFTEANISASGDTAADAIANFKESLASRFEILQSKSQNEMGLLPKRQWGILQSVVKRME
jgi:hypothetical protein